MENQVHVSSDGRILIETENELIEVTHAEAIALLQKLSWAIDSVNNISVYKDVVDESFECDCAYCLDDDDEDFDDEDFDDDDDDLEDDDDEQQYY